MSLSQELLCLLVPSWLVENDSNWHIHKTKFILSEALYCFLQELNTGGLDSSAERQSGGRQSVRQQSKKGLGIKQENILHDRFPLLLPVTQM